jgi:GNAT superfamily N-acetyltransferase
MKGESKIVVSESHPIDVIQFLEERIYEHNSSLIGKTDGRFFAKTVRDSEENIIAGVSGWTWAGVSEITLLWVKDECRNQGLGALLLMAAEEEARKNNCNAILLRSFAFQAPSFYQKHGYQIESVTKDFPTGHDYYCLIKRMVGLLR